MKQPLIPTTHLRHPAKGWSPFGTLLVVRERGSMPPNQDFKDLFVELNGQGVEFLVVGAHSLAAHGHVRATKDLDIWVRPDRENTVRILRALTAFGAPTNTVTEDHFAVPGITFQI